MAVRFGKAVCIRPLEWRHLRTCHLAETHQPRQGRHLCRNRIPKHFPTPSGAASSARPPDDIAPTELVIYTECPTTNMPRRRRFVLFLRRRLAGVFPDEAFSTKVAGEHTRPGCSWTRPASSLWARGAIGNFETFRCLRGFPRGRGKCTRGACAPHFSAGISPAYFPAKPFPPKLLGSTPAPGVAGRAPRPAFGREARLGTLRLSGASGVFREARKTAREARALPIKKTSA